MDALSVIYALILLACGFALLYRNYAVVVIVLYLFLYVIYNLFKPISAAAVSDLAGKELRATALSLESLLRTVSSYFTLLSSR